MCTEPATSMPGTKLFGSLCLVNSYHTPPLPLLPHFLLLFIIILKSAFVDKWKLIPVF